MNLTITNASCEDIVYNGNYLEKLVYNGDVVWEKQHDLYISDYLTLVSLEDGNTLSFIMGNGPSSTPEEYENTFYYSTDGQSWTSSNTTTNWSLNAGQKIMLKATALSWCLGSWHFSSTKQFKVQGNVMSIIRGANFTSDSTLPSGEACFVALFKDAANLVDASGLCMPATTLTPSCYNKMFLNCTSLRRAPMLQATTLAARCYESMFTNCTSLQKAPDLPAAGVPIWAYHSMFQGCTSLVNGPTISATFINEAGCYGMFKGCTSLVNAPALMCTNFRDQCYRDMFWGCTSLATAPALPSTTLYWGCYMNMFNSCTSLVNAPQLAAETSAAYCYYGMFTNCTSLMTAPDLLSTTTAARRYDYMFDGCASLNYIKCLANSISFTNWVRGVAATGTFVRSSSATGWTVGVNGIPNGWTVTTA